MDLRKKTKDLDKNSAIRAVLLWFLFLSFFFITSSFYFFHFWKPEVSSLGQVSQSFFLGLTPWVWLFLITNCWFPLYFWKWRTRMQKWGRAGSSCRTKTVQRAGTQKEAPQGALCPLRRLRACSVASSCPTLCNPIACSSPGPSVHGILQARILECIARPSFRRSSCHRDRTRLSYVSCVGRWGLYR